MLLAKEILMCILPKWNPATCTTPYSLTISPEQLDNTSDDQDDRNRTPSFFNPIIPSPETVAEGFRIFSNPNPPCPISASQTKTHQRPPPELVKITITGTHNVNKDGDHEAGGCAWLGTRDTRNLSIKIPEELAAAGAGEAGVLLTAITKIPSNAPIQITTKSIALRKDLTSNLSKLEDTNWTAHPHEKLMKAIVAKLRTRSALTSFSEWNNATPKHNSDEILSLTQDSILKEKSDDIPTEIHEPMQLTGMKLTAGSQRLFYLNIRQSHNPAKERRRTVMNMAITQHAVLEISGKMPSREQVWLSIRDRDIPKSIRGFLWKSIHGAYKIGEFWDKIPNYEGRGECGICRVPETMEHILTECDSLHQ
jgi:hypothetical protein